LAAKPEPKPCRLVRNSTNLCLKTPCVGLDSALRPSEVLGRSLTFTRREPRVPFCAWPSNHLVRDWDVVLHYSILPQRTLRGAWVILEKIPRTDVCNRLTKRAFANRSSPERAAFAELAACGSEVIQVRKATPDDLAVVRASGGRAVDAAVQLWTNHAQRSLL
jgi:hypothetical protein